VCPVGEEGQQLSSLRFDVAGKFLCDDNVLRDFLSSDSFLTIVGQFIIVKLICYIASRKFERQKFSGGSLMKHMKTVCKMSLALLLTIALALGGVRAGMAQDETVCVAEEQSQIVIAETLTLTWDSAFACADVPETGTYSIEVTVSLSSGGENEESAETTVVVESLALFMVTPQPGGISPDATAEASGLPLTLIPGESGSFGVMGSYELVQTDEGSKVNLHILASGTAGTGAEPPENGVEELESEGEPFDLGINLIFTGIDEPDDDDNGDDDPSSGFYCTQSDIPHPFGARLAEHYNVEYTILQEWFCSGFGWGQVMLALQTGTITGEDPGGLLARRSNGEGWGNIWQSLRLIGPFRQGNSTDGEAVENQSTFTHQLNNGKDDNGRPDFAGPPNDKGGKGRPDFAGPPNGNGKGRP
jgi:hypothetical protein